MVAIVLPVSLLLAQVPDGVHPVGVLRVSPVYVGQLSCSI